MKTKFSPKQIGFFSILIVLGILGAYLGLITYQFKIVTRGILSLLVLYLVLRVAAFASKEKMDDLFVFPKNLRYYIFAFCWSVFGFWALGFLVEMILFLLD